MSQSLRVTFMGVEYIHSRRSTTERSVLGVLLLGLFCLAVSQPLRASPSPREETTMGKKVDAPSSSLYALLVNLRLQRRTQGSIHLISTIQQAAKKHGIRADLLAKVLYIETNANQPCVTSHAGAQGLAQLMPGTAKMLKVYDAFEPRQAIHGGAKYLALLLKKANNNDVLAVAAYNWGPKAIKRPFKRYPAETKAYVTRFRRLSHFNGEGWQQVLPTWVEKTNHRICKRKRNVGAK
jgi:hypothetical protein